MPSLAAVYGEDSSSSDHVIPPRDIRTITSGPVFYEPLASLPRGNVRFVLVGGPMEYVDRRGEHRCVTGEAPDGGAEADFAESVARMSAMVDSRPWVQAATQTGQAIMTSLIRARRGSSPVRAPSVSYVTSTFRDVVKAVAGALPKKVAEDAWRIGPVGKSRWSYQRDAAHYIYNAHAGFTYITVESAPAVCIWAWPDRSDLVLQAFLDTVAVGTADPVTVILPDVPAFREFARRYVRGEHMDKVERAPDGGVLVPLPARSGRPSAGTCCLPSSHHGSSYTPTEPSDDGAVSREHACIPRRPPHAAAVRLGRPRRRAAARGRDGDTGRCAAVLRVGVRSLRHGAMACPERGVRGRRRAAAPVPPQPARRGDLRMTTPPGAVPLDPRRYFTAAEVTAAWLLQERTCRECGRNVPRDLVEGDHIVAWSRGGPTTMENLQALCIACNRRKGIREGVAEEKLAAAVAVSTAPLRRWQERAAGNGAQRYRARPHRGVPRRREDPLRTGVHRPPV